MNAESDVLYGTLKICISGGIGTKCVYSSNEGGILPLITIRNFLTLLDLKIYLDWLPKLYYNIKLKTIVIGIMIMTVIVVVLPAKCKVYLGVVPSESCLPNSLANVSRS